MEILRVENIFKRFGGVAALGGVSIALDEGKIYGLIGPNGSGKTTLLNVMTGLFRPDRGNIYFRENRMNGKPPHILARAGIGRTFQIPRVFPNLTVEENVLSVLGRTSKTNSEDLLGIFLLQHLSDTKANLLGYGQRKQLELARVLALNPTVVILDEPMAGLDSEMINEMTKYLRKMNRDMGKTLLIVEHNLEVLLSLADHIFVLNHGIKLFEGDSQSVRENKAVLTAYFGD